MSLARIRKPALVILLLLLALLVPGSAVTAAPGNAAPETCIPRPERLVSWWPGDGSPNDIAGTNHGVLRNGATFTSGYVGQAFSFDGVDDHVHIGDPTNLRISGQLTLAAWVKPTTAPPRDYSDLPGIRSIITKWGQSQATDAYGIWLHNPDGNVRLMGAIGVPGSSDPGLRNGGVIPLGQWSHVAMTYDRSSGLNRLYMNGTKVAERVRTGGITVSNLSVLIGKEDSSRPRFFSGQIDEAQVFDRALSPNEISAIFAAGTAGLCRCETPFFWQRDPLWADHPLRSNGQCSSDYDTIGEGGCTLTSAAMVFRHLGARFSTFVPMDPPNLSDCMGTSACYFNWTAGSACTNGKAGTPRVYPFTWSRLHQEINQNHRPVILGMHLKGNPDDTHWVVVTRGQGSDPASYYMYDPWYKCGQNMKLSHYSGRYDFDWIAVYQGEATCSFSSAAPQCERSAAPVPVPVTAATDTGWFDRQTQRELLLRENPSDASALSGSVLLYRATEITMTVELSATATIGNVTEMLIWSDTLANTTWQAFSPLAWLPLSDSVYVRFRNQFGDVSETYSDTTIPAAPIALPDPERVYLPLIRK